MLTSQPWDMPMLKMNFQGKPYLNLNEIRNISCVFFQCEVFAHYFLSILSIFDFFVRPDGLAYCYPALSGTGWNNDREDESNADYWDVTIIHSKEAESLLFNTEVIQDTDEFVPPPAVFMFADLDDDCCDYSIEVEPYMTACDKAGVHVESVIGEYEGMHGCGLDETWTESFEEWANNLIQNFQR